jgi:hypothetical protein
MIAVWALTGAAIAKPEIAKPEITKNVATNIFFITASMSRKKEKGKRKKEKGKLIEENR